MCKVRMIKKIPYIMFRINCSRFIKLFFILVLFLNFLQCFYLYSLFNISNTKSPNKDLEPLFYLKIRSKTYQKPPPPFTEKLSNINSKDEYDSSTRVMNELNLPLCATRKSMLKGLTKVSLEEQPPSLASLNQIHSDIPLGGHFKPSTCRSKDKVAIIIPYRDRGEHLRTFLFNLIPMLKRQQIEFNIFVIEQGGSTKDEAFNRAMLFNVGFVEANKRGEYDCFIFHDVDLIPENDYNLYDCPLQPRHMSVAVDTLKYRLKYRTLFGGISALNKKDFMKINGFSNSFWGWGGEDDDMAGRIAYNMLYVSRRSPNIGRYKMIKHEPQMISNERLNILKKGRKRFKTDGLSNLNYTVEQITLENTFTLVKVQLVKSKPIESEDVVINYYY